MANISANSDDSSPSPASAAQVDTTTFPTFAVDTHLFRELGELLVGRESTALVELVKNAYDADATGITVHGDALESAENGRIVLADDGIGMNLSEFTSGFLTIASRSKDSGSRRSARLNRRFTGAKGVGRLAAHKLARVIEVTSLRWDGSSSNPPTAVTGVRGRIDWDAIEALRTLSDIAGSGAVSVESFELARPARPGTTITLTRLRKAWTKASRARFLEEIQTFEAPRVLTDALPSTVVGRKPLLFANPTARDAGSGSGESFAISLGGELVPEDDRFQAQAEAAAWILEIVADKDTGRVRYAVAPSSKTQEKYPDAESVFAEIDHPDAKTGPFFQARVLIRTGRAWTASTAGVRVFLEAFRVLPYGEGGNDWLEIDSDYSKRGRTFLSRDDEDPLSAILSAADAEDEEGLLHLPNRNHFGAVFLTHEGARGMRMLVNREGFVPGPSLDTLSSLVRGGIDLATRVRAAATASARESRRQRKREREPEASLPEVILNAQKTAGEARRLIAGGDAKGAEKLLTQALQLLDGAADLTADVISERSMIRVLASVGTQMAAFIHELNGLLSMAESVDNALKRLRNPHGKSLGRRESTSALTAISSAVGDLRHNIDRQASYLIDIVGAGAKRRRAKQKLAERFEGARRLVEHAASARGITIENGIPATVQSGAMFPAEITAVFSNLLTNAVKAAGENGRIRATGHRSPGSVSIVIENTGIAVDVARSEKWFRPFQSSTAKVDTVLGQGMGLGLTITRSILEEYGATVRFIQPSRGFATAAEVTMLLQ